MRHRADKACENQSEELSSSGWSVSSINICISLRSRDRFQINHLIKHISAITYASINIRALE